MEAAISILLAALEGANLVHDIGYMGQGLIGNPAAIVMCSEIIGYVKRIIQGIDMSRERIGLEVIRQVGPGGNFLMDKRTRNLHRQEHWRPKFLNRDSPEIWKEKGGKSYGNICTEKAIQILETHKPEPLPNGVHHTVSEIATKAEVSLRGIDFVA
jgi:trimethylamine--corrinoid protein Co-methyltransferase